MINDDENTTKVSDFTLHVLGDTASPGSFTGSGEGTPVTINAEDYGVYED